MAEFASKSGKTRVHITRSGRDTFFFGMDSPFCSGVYSVVVATREVLHAMESGVRTIVRIHRWVSAVTGSDRRKRERRARRQSALFRGRRASR